MEKNALENVGIGKRLLDVGDLRAQYGLSRGLAYGLLKALPHVRAGHRLLVRREDVEALLEQAVRQRRDLAEMVNPAGQGGA